MSGFRRFRSTLHRRRRSMMEFGYLGGPGGQTSAVRPAAASVAVVVDGSPDAAPLDFSPSAEARMIGPAPIAWLSTRRTRTDN